MTCHPGGPPFYWGRRRDRPSGAPLRGAFNRETVDLRPPASSNQAVSPAIEMRGRSGVPNQTATRLVRDFRQAGVLVLYAAVVLALWEFLVRLSRLPHFIVPLPSEVVHELVTRFPVLLSNSWITIYESLTGLGIAFGLGVAVAVLLAYSPLARLTLFPTTVAFESVPKVALAPLVVVWFGLGLQSKIATVVMICFFPIFMSTYRGLISVDPDYLDLLKGLGGTKQQLFRKVRLPWAVPYAFTGLRIAVPLAMVGAVIGEFVAAQRGLGYIILSTSQNLETPLTVAAIALVTFWSTVLFQLVAGAERLLLRLFPAVPAG